MMLERQGCRRPNRLRGFAAPLLSVFAVVIALSGVAYATDLLPANSVGQTQLKKRSVGSSQIRGKAIGPKHLKAGAVRGSQLQAGSVGSGKLAPGAVRTEDLGFALGSTGARSTQVQPVVETGHCGPWEGPGDPPSCPPPHPVRLLSEEVVLDGPAFLEVAANVELASEGVLGHTDGTATAGAWITVDGEPAAPRSERQFGFGQKDSVSPLGYAVLGAGAHRIELMADGFGFDYLDVDATSAVLTVTATPQL